jgi:D-sedoheptulose 7-phosphate isomerase
MQPPAVLTLSGRPITLANLGLFNYCSHEGDGVDKISLKTKMLQNAKESALTVEEFINTLADEIYEAAEKTVGALSDGKKVIAFGNGGSASDAEHLAAELVGRFLAERKALAAISLTTNSSAVTAIANDYGYENLFSRQIEAFAQKGDVVVGISTSGSSANVLKALRVAKEAGALTIGLTGHGHTPMHELCDFIFVAPSKKTPRIQECHLMWLHAFCETVEELWVLKKGKA